MAFKSLGKITVTSAGTPVRATANESTPTARYPVQMVRVTAPAGNTGTNIYVGASGFSKSTYAGLYGIVPKGTYQDFLIALAPEGILANEIFLDADTTNDVALVSVSEQ